MVGWGLGSALKNLSTKILTIDLADELDPLAARQTTSTSTSSSTYHQDDEDDQQAEYQDHPPKDESSSSKPQQTQQQQQQQQQQPSEHVRQMPEHQPAPELRADYLQNQMKNLMTKHPTLWALYKQQLSQTENNKDPQTIRSVLEEFLKEHHQELNPEEPPPPPKTPIRASLLQTFNASIAGITVAGLEEESTHVRTSMRDYTTTTHANDDNGDDEQYHHQQHHQQQQQQHYEEDSALPPMEEEDEEVKEDYENLTPDQMKDLMKLAMGKPELWALYKKQLSKEPNKRHPDTVKRVFVAFLHQHGRELNPPKTTTTTKTKTRQPPPKKPPTPKVKLPLPATPSTSATNNPSQSNTTTATTSATPRGAGGIFQNFNMSLMEESQHIRHFPDENDNDNERLKEEANRQQAEKEKQQQQQQQFEKEETQRRMHLLRCHPTLYPQFQEDLQTTDSNDFVSEFLKEHAQVLDAFEKRLEDERRQKEEERREAARKDSVFQTLNMSMHEESMYFDIDGGTLVSSPAKEGRRRSSLLSIDDTAPLRQMNASLPFHETASPISSNSERRPSRPSMYGRESITSRSARSLKLAMDSLAGEADETNTTPSSVPSNNGERRPSRPSMYGRDSITSRSARTLKLAVDSLAGEADETITPSHVTSNNSERRPSRPSMYGRDSITSRSARTLKLAVDSLAGEASETTASVPMGRPFLSSATKTSSQGATSQFDHLEGQPRSKPLPPSARTVWIETGKKEPDSSSSTNAAVSTPPKANQAVSDLNSSIANILAWSPIPTIASSLTRNSSSSKANHARISLAKEEMHDVDLLDGEGGSDDGGGGEGGVTKSASIRDSLRKVSTLFAQEMESLTLDLESEVSGHTSRRSQTLEDLPAPSQSSATSNSAFHGPLHNSCPINYFEPAILDEEDDWVLSEASEIALRRRRTNNNRPSALESIVDNEEDDDDDDNNSRKQQGEVSSDEPSPFEASVNDPMMQVTVHEETTTTKTVPRDAVASTSQAADTTAATTTKSDTEIAEDDEMGVTMHCDELPMPKKKLPTINDVKVPIPKQQSTVDELNDDDEEEEDLIDVTMHSNPGDQVQEEEPTNTTVSNDAADKSPVKVESKPEESHGESKDTSNNNAEENQPEQNLENENKVDTSPKDSADSDEGSLI